MSHAAQQIRDWFIAALTGVSGLPNAVEGMVRQVASETNACIVRTTTETAEPWTIHNPVTDQRVLNVEVVLIASTYDAVDALSMAAEEALASASSPPGLSIDFLGREYDENVESDRGYVSITINFVTRYAVARNNVDTFL